MLTRVNHTQESEHSLVRADGSDFVEAPVPGKQTANKYSALRVHPAAGAPCGQKEEVGKQKLANYSRAKR